MVGWGAAVQIVSGVAVLGIAVALMAINAAHRASRAYSLTIGLSGLMLVTAGLLLMLQRVATGIAAGYTHAYAMIALPFAALYFASVYPSRKSWLPRRAWAPLILLIPTVGFLAAYAVDHTLYWDLARHGTGVEPYWDEAIPKGPLVLFVRVVEVVAGGVALLLARSVVASRATLQRSGTLLASVGFFVPAACTCAIVDFIDRVASGLLLRGAEGGGLSTSVGLANDALLVLQMGIILTLLAYVASYARRTDRADMRRGLWAYVAFLAATSVSAVAIMTLLPTGATQSQGVYAIWGFWNLVGALLVAYGILKFQLFGIELGAKWTLRRGSVVGALAAAFFVGKESIEALLPGEGVMAGVGGAILVAGLVFPVAKAGNRLAERVMPGVADTPEYRGRRARDVYQAALEEMLRDGHVTPKERDMLDGLRHNLGLTEAEGSRIDRTMAAAQGR